MWSPGPGEVVAVGESGLRVHYDGDTPSGTFDWSTPTLQAVRGTSPSDIWAVGDNGTAFHWDGLTWTSSDTGVTDSLVSVWPTSTNDVWAVGANGTVVHWNGSSWQVVPTPATRLSGVWASGSSDAFAVGDVLIHWDGTTWSSQPSPSGATLSGVTGVNSSEVYVSTSLGVYVGPSSATYFSGAAVVGPALSGLEAVGSGAVLGVSQTANGPCQYDIALKERNGASWATAAHQTLGGHFEGSVFGPRLFAASSYGDVRISPWSNTPAALSPGVHELPVTNLTRIGCGVFGLCENICERGLSEVWGLETDDIWAVGYTGTVLHWDGCRWSTMSAGYNGYSPLGGLQGHNVRPWGLAANDVWMISQIGTSGGSSPQAEMDHWDGSSWTKVSWAYVATGLWGLAPDDVWTVGSISCAIGCDPTKAQHWDGSDWTVVTYPCAANSMTGAAQDDAWLSCSTTPTVAHWDGVNWVEEPLPAGSPAMTQLYAVSQDDTWGVGAGGAIIHWDGMTWSMISSGTTADLVGVWASGPNDAWATAKGGSILHWDGIAWSTDYSNPEFLPVARQDAIHGSGPSDVWFDQIHWDGVAFETFHSLGAFWSPSPGAFFTAGGESVAQKLAPP